MSRTILDLRVQGRGIPEVRAHLFKWLRSKDFTIIDVDSDGSAVKFPFGIVSLLLHPALDDTVATSVRYSGAVVIEFRLRPEAGCTVVHLEAYAAGAGPWREGEWELSERLHYMAGLPRLRGFAVVKELVEDLGLFSGAVAEGPTPTQPSSSSLPG